MKGLTAVVLTKNEEEMIADCLDSLTFCQKVIVVDNGSNDRTVEIAERFGASVEKNTKGDFATLRNIGKELVNTEWILYVDADERVTKELAESISFAIQNQSKFVGYKILRKNFYLGNHEWPYRDNLERLFKTNALKEWYGDVHESPKVQGQIGQLQGNILHYTHRNISAMLEKTIDWSKTEALLRYKTNHPKMSWWRFPRVMITAFVNSYIMQGGWKVGTVGIIESTYQSFSMFITYARLWELQQNHGKNTK